MKKSPAGRGRTGCLPCPDRKHGYSGAPCSRSSTSPLCRLSMILCRRWWNSCLTCSAFFGRSHLIPSRFSKCPRSCLRTSLCERSFASRSWRNSWWKCRQSYPTPGCSYERSRTLTFQFLVVEGEFLVFKVFFPDRVLQRCLPLNAFLQSVEFPVGGGFQDFLPAGVHGSADGPGAGVFRTFPKITKVRLWARTRGRNCSPSGAHPRRELMWTPGLMATTSGSAWTLCMGHSGKSCCQTTFSGSRRGNGADGSMVASVVWCGSLLVAEKPERSWLMRSPGLPSNTVAWSSRWCRLLPVSVVASSRNSHLESVQYFRVPQNGSHCSVRVGVAYEFENWILGRCLFACAILRSTVDTCSLRALEEFTFFLRCGEHES